MSLHCLPRIGWTTKLAFRYRKTSTLINSCSICGIDNQIDRVGLTAAGLTGSTWRQIPGLTSSTWRQISTSSNHWVRGRNSSFRFRRRGGSTVVLLDQFIKQTNVDGSLVAKAPFSISCSGSYFDPDHNVDGVKNKEISESRDQFFKEERDRRREESRYRLENKLLNSPGSQGESSEEFKPLPDNGAGLFLQAEDLPPGREINEVEQRILDQLTGSSQDHDHQALLKRIQSRTRTPLHFKLFGKSNIRVDSYSIIRARAHSSHIYISDVGSVEEAVGMMTENGENGEGKFSPSGSVSIWRPRQVSEVEITEPVPGWNEEEEVVSALKVYAPPHLTEDTDTGLKGVFLCPTLMNKIYLEGEKSASIDLNGKLMDQLVSVGLCTEFGTIRVRDLWAHEINLASRFGDIVCEGTVEGCITAEIFGDGDFVSRILVSNKLKVTTDSGDISLWSDCFAELAELYTVTGNIHLRYLYGTANILVKQQGNVSVNLVEGSLVAIVKTGSMFVNVEELTEDSHLEVEKGDITVTVPSKHSFRISVTGSTLDISPQIINAGEFYLSGSGEECFVSGVTTGPSEYLPTLTVKSQNGRVTLQKQPENEEGRKRRLRQKFQDEI